MIWHRIKIFYVGFFPLTIVNFISDISYCEFPPENKQLNSRFYDHPEAFGCTLLIHPNSNYILTWESMSNTLYFRFTSFLYCV